MVSKIQTNLDLIKQKVQDKLFKGTINYNVNNKHFENFESFSEHRRGIVQNISKFINKQTYNITFSCLLEVLAALDLKFITNYEPANHFLLENGNEGLAPFIKKLRTVNNVAKKAFINAGIGNITLFSIEEYKENRKNMFNFYFIKLVEIYQYFEITISIK